MRCSDRTASKNFIFRIAESKKNGRAFPGFPAAAAIPAVCASASIMIYAGHEWISGKMASEDWIIAAKYCRAFR